MTHLKTFSLKNGIIMISFLMALSFISCASTNVENQNDDNLSCSDFPKLKYFDSKKMDNFIPLVTSSRTPKDTIKSYLDKWQTEYPEDSDLFQANFLYYLNNSITFGENPDVTILPGEHYNLTADNKTGELCYFYKDRTVVMETFLRAIKSLENGIEKYPNRLDYWDNLIKAYTTNYMYKEAEEAALNFLDTVKKAEKCKADWYTLHNEKAEFESKLDRELSLLSLVTPYMKTWLQDYNSPKAIAAAQNVAVKFTDVYPDNPFSYSNAGLPFMETDTEKALAYFEKAHELDPSYVPFSFDIAVCSLLTGDIEKFNKHSTIIHNCGDEEFIQYFDENINMILSAIMSEMPEF